MPRRSTLEDDELLRRARAVFVERGYGVPTKQIAAAVGLTWGAVALRFGNNWQLFRRALLVCDVARRFVGRERAPARDPEFAARVARLLAPGPHHS